jgi:hypothetical protein
LASVALLAACSSSSSGGSGNGGTQTTTTTTSSCQQSSSNNYVCQDLGSGKLCKCNGGTDYNLTEDQAKAQCGGSSSSGDCDSGAGGSTPAGDGG